MLSENSPGTHLINVPSTISLASYPLIFLTTVSTKRAMYVTSFDHAAIKGKFENVAINQK